MFVCFQLTFLATAASGLLLIFAPEEPSLQVGGGEQYALVPGVCLLVAAACTMLVTIVGFVGVYRGCACDVTNHVRGRDRPF